MHMGASIALRLQATSLSFIGPHPLQFPDTPLPIEPFMTNSSNHQRGCPCCSPYVWQAFPQARKSLNNIDRRSFLGLSALVTSTLLGGDSQASSNTASLAAAAAFAAPKITATARRTAKPHATHPQTIYKGGLIRTMNDNAPTASGLAVTDGLISALGDQADIAALAGPDTRIVDLNGLTMTPGFIDSHGHIAITALMSAFANLAPPPAGPVRSIADIQAALRKYREQTGGGRGGWLLGTNYDDSLLAEKRIPTRADLDEVSTDQPILIFHASLHVAVVNSKALEIAGVTASTDDPDGGVIRRYPDSREPNGIFEELALQMVMAHMPQSSPTELRDLLDKTQDQYAAWGITTAQDGATQPRDYRMLVDAAEQNRLKIDVLAYPFFQYADAIAASDIQMGKDYNGLKIGGIKLLLDGSPQAKTAWLSKPYEVPPKGQPDDYAGYPILPDDTVAKLVDDAFGRGWQVFAHCNGDAAGDQFIKAVSAATERHGRGDRRTTMIHAQTVREDQLDQMADLGIMPSFFVTHTYYWGDWHRDSVLGAERAARISPVRSAIDRNMPFTLHNDSPVAPSDTRMLLWAATTRQTRSGQVLGEEQRVTALEALRGLTSDAAFEHFENDTKGTLEVGKKADLTLLADDPATLEPDRLKDLEIVQTIKAGEAIYSKI